MKTQCMFSAFILFTYFKNKTKTTGFSISVHDSPVAALSALSPLLRFLTFQMRFTADFLFQTSISENLCLSARKCNPG